MSAQLPDDLPEELKEMGDVLAIHRTELALPIFGAFVFLVLGGCLCVVGAAPLFVAAQQGEVLLCLRMGIPGIVFFVWGISTLRNCLRKPQALVFVFRQTLACVQRGKVVEIIPWEDLDRVWRVDGKHRNSYCIPCEGNYCLVLDRRDGRRFVFNESLSRYRSFSRLVREQTLRYMLPPALQAFDSGATIGFGDVSVNAEGIHCGQDTLPWDLFDRAEVSKGRLILYSRNAKKLFGRMDLSHLPNFHVLLALAEHARTRDHD